MHLQFKATENFKAYHEPEGIYVRDGGIVEVEEGKGRGLLADYPQNFFQVTVEEIEVDMETAAETIEIPVVEAAPNKMITETRPRGQKRKGKR